MMRFAGLAAHACRALRSSATAPSRQCLLFSSAADTRAAQHWSLRALKTTAVGAGTVAVALPFGAAGVIVASSKASDADVPTLEMFGSLPRTLKVLWWR